MRVGQRVRVEMPGFHFHDRLGTIEAIDEGIPGVVAYKPRGNYKVKIDGTDYECRFNEEELQGLEDGDELECTSHSSS